MPPRAVRGLPPRGVPGGYVPIAPNGAAELPYIAAPSSGLANGQAWVGTSSFDAEWRSNGTTRQAERTSRKNQASGYLGLDASSKVAVAGSVNNAAIEAAAGIEGSKIATSSEGARGVAFRAADVGALTDNTGETPDTTIAQVDSAIGVASSGIDTVQRTNVPSISDVQSRFNLANENFADIAAQLNQLRTVLRNAGLMT